jgi:ferritin-like metal-binding protein YciE
MFNEPFYMRLTSLKLESVEDLFLAELRDLYDAENQLLKALPKLAEAASAPALNEVNARAISTAS